MEREIAAPSRGVGGVLGADQLVLKVDLLATITGLDLEVETLVHSSSAGGLENKKFTGLLNNQLAIPNNYYVNREHYRLQMAPSRTCNWSCRICQTGEAVAGKDIFIKGLR